MGNSLYENRMIIKFYKHSLNRLKMSERACQLWAYETMREFDECVKIMVLWCC